MCIFILGTGRSGSNIILEILSGSSKLNSPGNGVEYKFGNPEKYESNSLLKSDIVSFDTEDVLRVKDKNPDMRIIFTIRDPRDICMSKIKRGRPRSMGGDCSGFPDDGTVTGCVKNLKQMVDIYKNLEKYEYCMLVRMEDVLLNTKFWTEIMCDFIGIPFEKSMLCFYDRMRNPRKKERYNKIDLTQIEMWRNWQSAYDGFFVENNIDMEKIFFEVRDMVKYFGYNTRTSN
jgi:hypothetical protein